MTASPTESPADRLVRAAEDWINKSASRFGVETPNLDVAGSSVVKMAPFIFTPKRCKAFEVVIGQLGKLADLLHVVLVVEDVPVPEIGVYTKLGFAPDGVYMVRRPRLLENMSPFAQWRRWWGNTVTGEMLGVPSGTDDDDYLFKHQDQFDIHPEFTSWNDLDELLEKAYREGWQAVRYDSSNHNLMMRYAPKHSKQYAIRRIAQTVAEQYPVDKIHVDVMDGPTEGKSKFELEGERLDRFMRSGRLPRS